MIRSSISALRDQALLAKSLVYSTLASTRNLPGRRFERFGRTLGWRQKRAGKPARQLLINPVSSVRYFEFDFVERYLPDRPGLSILDVSSPCLFGYFVSESRSCDYLYTNLDEREFQQIADQIPRVRVKGNYRYETHDGRALRCTDALFDVVLSISVVEHIPDSGDTQAISEMWRVLKPGGILLLTFPVRAAYLDEYRDEDVYRAGLERIGDKFFFQRFYDQTAIEKRILSCLGGSDNQTFEIYGERRAGFFAEYEYRWIKNGLRETAKDPYLMSRNMIRFNSIVNLPGVGISGLCVKKMG